MAGSGRRGGLWEVLVFDRMITGPVIHLVYWAGMAVILGAAPSVVGASIGVFFREGSWASLLLALPVLILLLLARPLAAALLLAGFLTRVLALLSGMSLVRHARSPFR